MGRRGRRARHRLRYATCEPCVAGDGHILWARVTDCEPDHPDAIPRPVAEAWARIDAGKHIWRAEEEVAAWIDAHPEWDDYLH